MRTVDLDPDFRRTPKTERFCYLCQKDIRPGRARIAHVIDGGCRVLHPADETAYTPNAGDMGAQLFGPDCARKIGLEFTVPETEG